MDLHARLFRSKLRVMSRIFLSHSSKNNDSAVALRDWLSAEGWDDVFLDLDPTRGIAAGDRWERSLNQAALRCEAVLFLVSRAWLASDWCLKEFNLAHRLNKRLFGLLIEDIPIGELPATLVGTWQLVPLATGRDHIMMRAILPGSHDEVHVTFSQEGLMRLRVGLERAGLDAGFFHWPPPDDPKRPPYRGLLPLEVADAGIFFGREAPTIETIDRIRGMRDGTAPRLLVLLGASGAGKSSFLRAGLLPRLARDDRNYVVFPVIRPEKAAITGEAGLLRSLHAGFIAQGATMPRANIRQAIEGGSATLRPLLQTLIKRAQSTFVADDANAKPPLLLLAIDQGEELFLTDGASESAALLNLLRELLTDAAADLLVVITIRSDAYELLQTAKPLEGVTQQTLGLLPMPRGAYQAVIEGPVTRLKQTDRPLVIEPTLTQALLSDIEDGGGRDALPLLAFTLERLYLEYGDRGRLTLGDYDALGRIRGSIEAAIERAFRAADNDPRIPHDHDARLALLRRGLIPWLAGIDPDTGSPRRQKALISDIPEEARPLIDLLVEQRLLATDVAEGTKERTIEPAHESLLRQWGSLQGWLQEDFAALSTLETVKRAARDWEANARSDDWLAHRAGRLDDAERLLQRPDLAAKLDDTNRTYLADCRTKEDTERKEKTEALERRLKLTRRFSLAAAIAAIIMAGIGLYAYQAKVTAVSEANMARENLKQAKENLRQSGINQNHFLARESTLALRNGHPSVAINLALEALPGENGDQSTYVDDAADALVNGLANLRERHILGHEDVVMDAEFSPDGALIVTTSQDTTARLWNAGSGKQLAVLKHESFVDHAVFSQDGTRLVTVSGNSASVWDTSTGDQLTQLKHGAEVTSAAFSPEGTRIVTASEDDTARLWDAATGKQLALLQHDGRVRSAAFSPDGTRIITACDDNTARLWETSTGKQLALFNDDAAVESAAFSPDGSRIVTVSVRNTAHIWEAATATRLASLKHDNDVMTAKFNRDGSRIVTASLDDTVRLWDAVTGRQLALFDNKASETAVASYGINNRSASAEFSPNGLWIVTSRNNTVRVWDLASERQFALFLHDGNVHRAAFSPDGANIVTASDDHAARVWGTTARSELALLQHAGAVLSATFSPDGTKIVTASLDKTARLWDASTGQQLASFKHEASLNSAAFSPDGAKIITVSQDNTADLWDIATRKHLLLFKHEDSIRCAAFSPDGTRIVTASSDNTARLWDVATGRQIALFRHDNGVVRAVFSLDGTRIVTASDDHTARLWDVATGQQLALFQHDNDVADAAFSPDGSRIVTASMDDTVRLWDTATGKRLALFRNDPIDTSASFGGMTIETASARFSPDGSKIIAARNNTARQWDAVSGDQLWTARNTVSASFSPDGAQVLTVAADHTARLFEAAAMHELALFEHGAMVRSAAFSPDGTRIVTASNDYTARVWRAPGATTDELIKTARTEVQECLTAAQRKDVFLPERIPNWCYDMAKWPLRPLRWGISVADTVNKGDGKQWVRVIAVQPDLPAAVAGFKEGDIIVSANGEAIGDTKSFIAALASDKVRAGAETRIAIVRDEATLELKMKPRF